MMFESETATSPMISLEKRKEIELNGMVPLGKGPSIQGWILAEGCHRRLAHLRRARSTAWLRSASVMCESVVLSQPSSLDSFQGR